MVGFILAGNRRFRVTATIPLERIAEFVDAPPNGLLEVEPLLRNRMSG